MIKLKNVHKKFDHRGIAGVHNINLELKKGEIIAIMGPNGSGKSTLLNLMSGQITPDTGSINVHGKIHFFNNATFTKDLNVQKFLVQSITLDIDEEKKVQLARDLADIFEFTFQLRQNLGQLSQGQLQKVLMASELINQPEIIFLDEPFNHLDPFSRQEILTALFSYLKHKEATVVWVTHDRTEALKFANEICILNFGKIEQIDTPEKISMSPSSLFVAQFMGQKNFIPVTQISDKTWLTPWGPQKLNGLSVKDTALLCIPPYAWKIDSTSSFQTEITQQHMAYLIREIIVEWNSKHFTLHLPPTVQVNGNGKKLRITPEFEHCFLLPL